MAQHHELMGGKLHLYKRENSSNWQASTFLNGKNWRVSTKQYSLAHAKDVAEDWYLGLRGKARSGELKTGKKFRDAAKHFVSTHLILMAGKRSEVYVEGCKRRLKVHLLPFFGDKILSEIGPGLVQEYRVHRAQAVTQNGGPPASSTLQAEIVVLRQVLKSAHREGWLSFVPDLSPAYKASSEILYRPWLSPDEYRKLYEATRRRAEQPLKRRWKWACEQLHDYVLFMANTGLRPSEAARVEFRHVSIVKDDATKKTILEIEVRGKRGVGRCKSTANAVLSFKRLKERPRLKKSPDGSVKNKLVKPDPTDRLFPTKVRELLNTILTEEGLKRDHGGKMRTAHSLRHTYIRFRLLERLDIYQIAKNCRTSVEMIEKFYVNTLDAGVTTSKREISGERPESAKRRKPNSTNFSVAPDIC
jgi:integrase